MVAVVPHLRDFIDYVTFQKSYSTHTARAYERDLQQYFTYQLEQFETVSPLETKGEFVRSWIVELIEEGHKPTTVNRKLSTLKSFVNYLRIVGKLDRNPLTGIRNLKVPAKIPVYVRSAEVDRLLDHVEELEPLEAAVVGLLYHTGIRRAELIDLSLNQVDFNKKQIKVLGKGRKERIVPMSSELEQILSRYLAERSRTETSSNRFFLLPSGKPLYPKWVYNCVTRVLSVHTRVSKQSPHVLRHSFATHLLQNGAEIMAIKELLGHASLSSTQIYAQSDIAHLKKVHKLHPKS